MKFFLALVLSLSLVVPGASFAAAPKKQMKKQEVKKMIKKETLKKEVMKKEVKKPEPKKEIPLPKKDEKPAPKAAEVKSPETKVPEKKPEMKKEEAVTIKNFAFSPVDLTVKKGTVVTWTNEDSARHNAHSSKEGGPNGPLLGQGEKYSFTANTVGTFDYVCDPHAGFMTGKLTVTE